MEGHIYISIDKFAVENQNKAWKDGYISGYLDFIIIAITVLIVAIPGGSSSCHHYTLTYSVKKCCYDNNLVRHLDVCETMGMIK
ncbi:P-type ATPase (P-ATPase) [Phytophthora megakarya]|uniref:P-type ATPase (P-ATPase) n=1 Tax=Phytophthora megakarya TaxID=4795 RepID=A0A225WIG6_9STRA|nr:P-type ATPase (P-ATPase) [Phytophthora megakarya]